jgi:D-xylonolactonase
VARACPVWDARDGALYFVDIKGHALHRCSLDGQERRSWPMAEPICWVIPRRDRPGFIAGFKSGFAELQLEPFALTPICAPEPDRPTNRLNDAKADRHGCIWAGSMDDEETRVSGALYRLATDRSWTRADDGYAVANGPAFSLDGRRLYHTDTGEKVIYAFEVADDGTLSDKRTFIRFEDPAWGHPDGMTVDAEDHLWVAHWGGSRVSRFRPDGSLDRVVPVPASQVTSCVFAGPRLDRMFVTTAAVGREDEPLAGALFEIDPGVRGTPPHSFAG